MIIGIEEPVSTTAALPGAPRLPERLAQRWRTLLPAGEAVVVLFVSLVTLAGASNRILSALVLTAIVCGVSWQCGFYRRSFAVYARDEIYYALTTILLSAAPVFLVICGVAQVPALSVALALIFSAVGLAALRVRLFLERRPDTAFQARLSSITASAWHDREAVGYQLSKRALDVIVASLALIVTSPVMLLAALAIMIEDGRPVLFRQQRVGRDGIPFFILKFRTMRRDAGSEWAKPGDSRITRVGAFLRRTSLDELPQAFNVLRGHMSIAGPRPEMCSFAERFAELIPSYEQRHVVPPGITGWAQLYCKRNLDPSDVAQVLPYDLFYVQYSSAALDIALILKTAAEVLFHRAV
jgi:lipopolysaccharide/colanic/teichoic acid biosynthesis glycosyltransferase